VYASLSECESVLDFDPDELEEATLSSAMSAGTEFEVVAPTPRTVAMTQGL